MATANIPWDDGSGQNMSVEWDGTENGEIVITSPTNPSLSSSRNKTIQVRTTAGSPQITRTINVVQEAAVYTYEYEIQPSSSAVIAASGGTISYTATLKIYLQGSLLKTESVTPTCRIISGTGFSALSNAVTAANRGTEYSTSQRSAQVAVEFVTAETGETLSETVTVTQAANNRVIVYGKPTITSFEVADIPASGGSVSSGDVEYSQSRHYYYDSGQTEELSPLTTGGQVTFGDAVSADSLGTTVKSRTIVGQLTCQVAMNGQTSVEGDASVYQQANSATYGAITLIVTSPVSVEATGGTFDIVSQGGQTVSFTSGEIRAGSVSLSYSQLVPVEGFVLDGSQVTVSNNTTTEERSYTVRVTAEGEGGRSMIKSVKFNQDAGVRTYSDITIIEFKYPQISATGGTVTPTLSYSQTWGWNGSTTGGGTITSGAQVSYSGTNVDASTGAATVASKGATVSGVTTATTATVTVSMNGKTAEKSADVQQEANTITVRVISSGGIDYGGNSIPASGGSMYIATFDPCCVVSYSSGASVENPEGVTYSKNFVILDSHGLGFTIDPNTGQLTATSRGTTPGEEVYASIVCNLIATYQGVSSESYAWSINDGGQKANIPTISFVRAQGQSNTYPYMARENVVLAALVSPSVTFTSGASFEDDAAKSQFFLDYISFEVSSYDGTSTYPWITNYELAVDSRVSVITLSADLLENTGATIRSARLLVKFNGDLEGEIASTDVTIQQRVYTYITWVEPTEIITEYSSTPFEFVANCNAVTRINFTNTSFVNALHKVTAEVTPGVEETCTMESQTSYTIPDGATKIHVYVYFASYMGVTELTTQVNAFYAFGSGSTDTLSIKLSAYLKVTNTSGAEISSLSFTASGGSQTIIIDTNESWTIE